MQHHCCCLRATCHATPWVAPKNVAQQRNASGARGVCEAGRSYCRQAAGMPGSWTCRRQGRCLRGGGPAESCVCVRLAPFARAHLAQVPTQPRAIVAARPGASAPASSSSPAPASARKHHLLLQRGCCHRRHAAAAPADLSGREGQWRGQCRRGLLGGRTAGRGGHLRLCVGPGKVG